MKIILLIFFVLVMVLGVFASVAFAWTVPGS